MNKYLLLTLGALAVGVVGLFGFYYLGGWNSGTSVSTTNKEELNFRQVLLTIKSDCEEVELTPQTQASWNVFDGDKRSLDYIVALSESIKTPSVNLNLDTKTFISEPGTQVYIEAFSKKMDIDNPVNMTMNAAKSCWVMWVEDFQTNKGILAYKTVSGKIKNLRVNNFFYLNP